MDEKQTAQAAPSTMAARQGQGVSDFREWIVACEARRSGRFSARRAPQRPALPMLDATYTSASMRT